MILNKKRVLGKNKTGGRNHAGRITSFHRGGGNKKNYRQILFNRKLGNFCEGYILKFVYDPNRDLPLAEVFWCGFPSFFSYILAPKDLFIGSKVLFSSSFRLIGALKAGYALPLSEMIVGSFFHNLNGKYARSCGSSMSLLQNDVKSNFSLVRLPSGEIKKVPSNWVATFGFLESSSFESNQLRKAGQNRWNGKRPKVRGVAMNPVDHPHGGGEGKTSGGRLSVTPWGKLTKGKLTVRKFCSKKV